MSPVFHRQQDGTRFQPLPLTLLLLAVLCGACERTSTQPPPEEPTKPQKVTTFLMFDGTAEEAMNFYVSVFNDAKVVSIRRYGPGQPGKEGSVMHATFSIAGQEFMCIDSSAKQNYAFTPAISLFVNCETETEFDTLFAKLSEGGKVFMPPDAYGVTRKFTWVADRYGVSWQLTLLNNKSP